MWHRRRYYSRSSFKDYEETYKPIADRYDIRVIMLITPETSEARVREIDEHTDGFIYMVSSAATTGAQKDFDSQKQAYFKKIQDMHLRNPRMVGFGIKVTNRHLMPLVPTLPVLSSVADSSPC